MIKLIIKKIIVNNTVYGGNTAAYSLVFPFLKIKRNCQLICDFFYSLFVLNFTWH